MGAVLHYDGAPNANPKDKASTTMRTTCDDEPSASLIPFVPNSVPTSVISKPDQLDIKSTQNATNNLFRWTIGGSTHIVDWNNPSLETVLSGSTNFGENSNVHEMTNNGWYLWWIQSTAQVRLPHPIHLHGQYVTPLPSNNNMLTSPSEFVPPASFPPLA